MKKIIYSLMIILVIVLCACNKEDDSSSQVNIASTTNSPSAKVEEISMPEAFKKGSEGTGGDEKIVYFSTVNCKINSIPGEFMQNIDQQELDEWFAKTGSAMTEEVDFNKQASLYTFVKRFNIPDETVKEYCIRVREYYISEKMSDEYYLTDSEIDLLLSDNIKDVAKHFVSKYAIEKDGNIYSPKWIYTHGIQDYAAEGLPINLVEEKVNQFKDSIPFTNEAKKALEVKVSNCQKYSSFKKAGKEIEFVPTPFNAENADINSKSVYDEEYFIDKNGNKYDMAWLSTHMIPDYQEAGIKTTDIKALLDTMSDYKQTKEYDWIDSIYIRMVDDGME